MAQTEPSAVALGVSPAQEGIWFDEQSGPPDAAYVDSHLFAIHGPLDVAALDAAVRQVIAAHPALRARFDLRDGRVVQRIAPAPASAVAHVVSVISVVSDPDELAWSPVTLTEGPLFQARLLRQGPMSWLLWLGVHHIVSDGHSAMIILRHVEACYEAAVTGGAMPELAADGYLEFSAAAAASSVPAGRAGAIAATFATAQALTFADGSHEPGSDRLAEQIERTVRWPTSRELAAIASRQRLTPVMLTIAAWGLVLARFSGAREFPIALASTCRDGRHWQDTVGMLVNTLPVLLTVDGEQAWSGYARSVRSRIARALADRDVPFAAVAAQARRDGLTAQLGAVMAGHEVVEHRFGLAGTSVTPVPQRAAVTPLRLDIVIDTTGGLVTVNLLWARGLATRATMTRMLEAYLAILRDLAVLDGDAPCGQLGRSRAGAPARPAGPDVLAVLGRDRPDLYARARSLAAGLAPRPVGVLMPAGEEQVCALAAGWLAAAPVVLLSAHDLPERLLWIIDELALGTVITDRPRTELPGFDGLILAPPPAAGPRPESARPGRCASDPARGLLTVVIEDAGNDVPLLMDAAFFGSLVAGQPGQPGQPGRAAAGIETLPSFVHAAAAAAMAAALRRHPPPAPSPPGALRPLGGTGLHDPATGTIAFPEAGGIVPASCLLVQEAGALAGEGEIGDLVVAMPSLPLGYAGLPGRTASAFTPDPSARGGRWFRTSLRARGRGAGIEIVAG